jgi:cell division protein FtsI/penicillin-binding protein 2
MTAPVASLRAQPLRRLFLFAILTGLAMAGLGVWLWVIQIWRHDHYREIALENTRRFHTKVARRGDILDRQGHPLATSYPVKRVLANPAFLGAHYAQVARALAPLLSYNEAELAAKLRPWHTNARGVLATNQYVDLRRKVTHEQWTLVTQAMARVELGVNEKLLKPRARAAYRALRTKGIYALEDHQRFYPGGRLAAHVLGYAHEVERQFTNAIGRGSFHEFLGADGIERWCDDKLRGTRGWRVTEADRRARELVVYRGQDVEAHAGLNVVLTLDAFIQHAAEARLAEAVARYRPASASVIVVRPRTGEILALASAPAYDPNRYWEASDDARRNRVIADMAEPGSTFKIIVVGAALHEGTVTLRDVFYCENGMFYFKGKPLRDHGQHKELTVEGIITKSSNIGAAKIAIERLGEQRLYRYITNFGFGQRTGVPLVGEIRGRVNPPSPRDGLAISRVPMGHAVSVTPIQMVMAMSAIASEGRLMRPQLIHSLRDAAGAVYWEFKPEPVRQAIHPRAAHDLITALKTVVTKDGTAPKAALDHHTVAGKTGTAQVAGPEGYVPDKYISSFIGFLPAEDPEVCIYVALNEPDKKAGYYGGQIAAPVFRALAEQIANYLKIRPDRMSEPVPALAGGRAPGAWQVAEARPVVP